MLYGWPHPSVSMAIYLYGRPYPSASMAPYSVCFVHTGSDAEYRCVIRELEEIREERLFVAEVFRDYEVQNAIGEHEREKALTLEELEVWGSHCC